MTCKECSLSSCLLSPKTGDLKVTAYTQTCMKLGPNIAGVTRTPTWQALKKKPRERHTQTLGHLARSAGESNLIKIKLSCQAPQRSSRSLILMNRACYRSCGGDVGWLEQELCLTAAGVSARGKARAARDTNERRQLQVSGFTFLQTVGIRRWRRPVLQSIKENTVEIKTRGMEQNRNKQV